jgi:oligogalacturonide lyase
MINYLSTALFAFACLAATTFAQQTSPAQTENPAGRRGRGPAASQPAAESLRKEWIDPDTGHRIFRLSTENNAGSLYFHYNAYSPDGKKVVFNSPSGITAADLETKKAELIVPGRFSAMEVSRTSNEVYYIDRSKNAVMAADLGTKMTRQVVAIPQGLMVACVNCDGTLFAGVIMNAAPPEGVPVAKADKIPAEDQFARMFPGKSPADLTPEQRSSAEKENRLARQLTQAVTSPTPRCLYTLNAKTGEVKRFGYAHAWLNHLQFSPIDPTLLMFCHEGTWHEVDRIWTIRVNEETPTPKLMHQRTMDMEIAGHEGFCPDGKGIFFDLQMPRSEKFFLAIEDLATGKETHYALDKNERGIHFAVSKDRTMFASDGGDPGQVAFAPDGEWINLFHVQPDGTLKREKLVNMAKHNYVTVASGGINGVEPNVTFSTDGAYVIFTGTFDGARHVYAVETRRSR